MFCFLLIDDSRVMRRMLRSTIRSLGYETSDFLEAANGREALERLEGVGYDVDAIFCDLCMPELDGMGFIDELVERGEIGRLPVIVCTGDVREGRGREALARGARELICKPFTPENVGDAIELALRTPATPVERADP